MSAQGSLQEVTSSPSVKHKGCCLWFTGLSGAGKSTISEALSAELKKRGAKFEVLDGDEVRENLSKGLGFSQEDRDTNIRRIGYVCHLLSRNGVISISAAISPYKAIRNQNRKMIGDFVEIFVSCPLEVLIERDVKGLYKKALAGEIKNFTGVSDPYEPPETPEIVVETNKETVEESTKKIMNYLEQNGWIESA